MRPHPALIRPSTVFITADGVPKLNDDTKYRRVYSKLVSEFERHCKPLGHQYLLLSRLDEIGARPDGTLMVSDEAMAQSMLPIGGVELQLTDGEFHLNPGQEDAYDAVHSMVLVHVPTLEDSGQPLAVTLGPCTIVAGRALLMNVLGGYTNWDTHIEAMMATISGGESPNSDYFVAPTSSWSEIVAGLSDRRMMKVLKEYSLSREAALNDDISNKRDEIRKAEARLDSLEKQLRRATQDLKEFYAKPISYEGIQEQIAEIMEHPGLADVQLSVVRGDGAPVLEVTFTTTMIDARDTTFLSCGIRRIGELQFSMLFPSGRVKVNNINNLGKRKLPHPHVGEDGSPCLGNCSAGLADAAASMDLVSAWHLLYGFASTFNSPDSWGRQYKYWPEVMPDGTLNEVFYNSSTAECSECGCCGIDDYDEYCEQEDLPYITHCEKCGNPVCQDGCAIFCGDDEYYYCSSCIESYYCNACDKYHSPGTGMYLCENCDSRTCEDGYYILDDNNEDPLYFCCEACGDAYKEAHPEEFEEDEPEEDEEEDEDE